MMEMQAQHDQMMTMGEEVDWSQLNVDVISHISEWYSFPLFRYSYMVLTRDYDASSRHLHRSMIPLLYGYSRHDPSRHIMLLFTTLDLSGYIYDFRAKELPLTNDLVYQMIPFSGVRGVNMQDCLQLTDNVLIPFANGPKLKQLVLKGVRIHDEAFMEHVSSCRNLETLDLSNTQVSSKTMNKLFSGDFPCLKRLDLSFVEDEFSRDDMDLLFQNHQLVYLSIFQNSYRPNTMKRIFRSRTLKQLKFDHDKRLNNKALIECIEISKIPNLFFETRRVFDCHEQLSSNLYLTELSLSAVDTEDYKIQALWTSKSIKRLTLFLENSTGKDVKFNYLAGIEKNETIEELHLLRCAQFDLSPLKHNTKIRELTLISASVDDQDLIDLCGTKNLTMLNVFHNDITGSEHFANFLLSQLTELRQLNIGWNSLETNFCSMISQHSSLRTLQIRRTDIMDQGANFLLQSPYITDLDISDNNLTDHAFSDLKLSSSLTRLDARQNILSNKAAKCIFESNSLFDVNLFQNNIGFAGVKAVENNSSIRILDISSNPISAASKLLLLKHKTLNTVSFSNNS